MQTSSPEEGLQNNNRSRTPTKNSSPFRFINENKNQDSTQKYIDPVAQRLYYSNQRSNSPRRSPQRSKSPQRIYNPKIGYLRQGQQNTKSTQNQNHIDTNTQKVVQIVTKNEITTRIIPDEELDYEGTQKTRIVSEPKLIKANGIDTIPKSRKKSPSKILQIQQPQFNVDQNKNYCEEKIEKLYITEIVTEQPKLTPLNDRDEFIFENTADEQHFKNEERRIVAQRRQEYTQPRIGELREVVETLIDRKRIRASLIIQRWFKNRNSLTESNKLSNSIQQTDSNKVLGNVRQSQQANSPNLSRVSIDQSSIKGNTKCDEQSNPRLSSQSKKQSVLSVNPSVKNKQQESNQDNQPISQFRNSEQYNNNKNIQPNNYLHSPQASNIQNPYSYVPDQSQSTENQKNYPNPEHTSQSQQIEYPQRTSQVNQTQPRLSTANQYPYRQSQINENPLVQSNTTQIPQRQSQYIQQPVSQPQQINQIPHRQSSYIQDPYRQSQIPVSLQRQSQIIQNPLSSQNQVDSHPEFNQKQSQNLNQPVTQPQSISQNLQRQSKYLEDPQRHSQNSVDPQRKSQILQSPQSQISQSYIEQNNPESTQTQPQRIQEQHPQQQNQLNPEELITKKQPNSLQDSRKSQVYGQDPKQNQNRQSQIVNDQPHLNYEHPLNSQIQQYPVTTNQKQSRSSQYINQDLRRSSKINQSSNDPKISQLPIYQDYEPHQDNHKSRRTSQYTEDHFDNQEENIFQQDPVISQHIQYQNPQRQSVMNQPRMSQVVSSQLQNNLYPNDLGYQDKSLRSSGISNQVPRDSTNNNNNNLPFSQELSSHRNSNYYPNQQQRLSQIQNSPTRSSQQLPQQIAQSIKEQPDNARLSVSSRKSNVSVNEPQQQNGQYQDQHNNQSDNHTRNVPVSGNGQPGRQNLAYSMPTNQPVILTIEDQKRAKHAYHKAQTMYIDKDQKNSIIFEEDPLQNSLQNSVCRDNIENLIPKVQIIQPNNNQFNEPINEEDPELLKKQSSNYLQYPINNEDNLSNSFNIHDPQLSIQDIHSQQSNPDQSDYQQQPIPNTINSAKQRQLADPRRQSAASKLGINSYNHQQSPQILYQQPSFGDLNKNNRFSQQYQPPEQNLINNQQLPSRSSVQVSRPSAIYQPQRQSQIHQNNDNRIPNENQTEQRQNIADSYFEDDSNDEIDEHQTQQQQTQYQHPHQVQPNQSQVSNLSQQQRQSQQHNIPRLSTNNLPPSYDNNNNNNRDSSYINQVNPRQSVANSQQTQRQITGSFGPNTDNNLNQQIPQSDFPRQSVIQSQKDTIPRQSVSQSQPRQSNAQLQYPTRQSFINKTQPQDHLQQQISQHQDEPQYIDDLVNEYNQLNLPSQDIRQTANYQILQNPQQQYDESQPQYITLHYQPQQQQQPIRQSESPQKNRNLLNVITNTRKPLSQSQPNQNYQQQQPVSHTSQSEEYPQSRKSSIAQPINPRQSQINGGPQYRQSVSPIQQNNDEFPPDQLNESQPEYIDPIHISQHPRQSQINQPNTRKSVMQQSPNNIIQQQSVPEQARQSFRATEFYATDSDQYSQEQNDHMDRLDSPFKEAELVLQSIKQPHKYYELGLSYEDYPIGYIEVNDPNFRKSLPSNNISVSNAKSPKSPNQRQTQNRQLAQTQVPHSNKQQNQQQHLQVNYSMHDIPKYQNQQQPNDFINNEQSKQLQKSINQQDYTNKYNQQEKDDQYSKRKGTAVFDIKQFQQAQTQIGQVIKNDYQQQYNLEDANTNNNPKRGTGLFNYKDYHQQQQNHSQKIVKNDQQQHNISSSYNPNRNSQFQSNKSNNQLSQSVQQNPYFDEY